ncbi:hypothetical protein [Paenibacillus alvei]|uniref:hypothetical protein n=1 Tax=Paenibacillus alvei TaxID=44250 RepID=UPI00227F5801|nr:hypothetical protein [Paenibacillus alvei]
MENSSITFHPGIYRFEWPYLASYCIPDENGEVKVYKCDVELRVGQDEDMKDEKLVTIIITSHAPPGVQNFIEHIATKIRIAFFDHIFYEKHWEKSIVPEKKIRWIERHLFAHRTGSTADDQIQEVIMNWNSKENRYTSPTWKPLLKI